MSSQELDNKIKKLREHLQAAEKKYDERKHQFDELSRKLEEARSRLNKKCSRLGSKPEPAELDLESLVNEVTELEKKRQRIQDQIKLYTEPKNIEQDPLYVEYMAEIRKQDEAYLSAASNQGLVPDDEPIERLRQLIEAINELKQENFELQQKLGVA